MGKLLIFDIDGVLGKKELITKARKNNLLKYIAKKFNIGMEKAEKQYEKAKDKLDSDKRTTSVYVFMTFGFTREEYFKVIDKVNPEGLVKLCENCKETIKQLSKNNVLVAYSNTPVKAATKTLKILKIEKYFDKLYSAEDFDESKPSTNNMKKIMIDMGFKTKNIFAIGDSLEKDIIPLHKLGIKTILFDPEQKYNHPKQADFVIKDIIELLDLV